MPAPHATAPRPYTLLLLFISGIGGLLYGYDVGIIGAALLFLGKTVQLSLAQTSLVVAAVTGGGAASSVVGGWLADRIGRKKVMIVAALVFAASVLLIVTAHGFRPLLFGRALQGLSAGMIAVVIPLYLAECLPARLRGRGTAAFQLVLTIGIMAAVGVGAFYTRGVDAAPAGDPAALAAAQDHAWRAMFLSALYPALLFLAGSCLVTESPRWLLRRGRVEEAHEALERSQGPREAEAEFARMLPVAAPVAGAGPGPLLQRRYLVPFFLACAVLGLTQTTGINSILQFVVVILQQAGLAPAAAAARATGVTAVNVAFTLAGLVLVDRLGRKALLMIGTGGITASLLAAAAVFTRSARGPATGDLVMGCLMVFIASFAIGPGVCVWIALSELMPTRIRSLGMGVGLLLNQGISAGLAAVFLPVVGRWGYGPIFLFCAACTAVYFLVAAVLLPETKGKTLEEIEAAFSRPPAPSRP
ncbi:MAG TPA: sugar porter family MFS transporter [Opitutaceae bacterium]|nr:sugar porter family MFS transporter [Opitutaceae bacterium]